MELVKEYKEKGLFLLNKEEKRKKEKDSKRKEKTCIYCDKSMSYKNYHKHLKT